jgi:tRNA(adenine34) deaminase
MRRALAVAASTPAEKRGHSTSRSGPVVLDPDGRELAAARNEREAAPTRRRTPRCWPCVRRPPKRGEWRLAGCTLVVTLEPCTMCAGALVLARIDTLVFGAWEPKTGAVGSLWDVVRDRRLNHRPEVYGGVLERECARLMRGFFTSYAVSRRGDLERALRPRAGRARSSDRA